MAYPSKAPTGGNTYRGTVIEVAEETDKKGRAYMVVKIKTKDKRVKQFVDYGGHVDQAEITEQDDVKIVTWEKNDRYIDQISKFTQKNFEHDEEQEDEESEDEHEEVIKHLRPIPEEVELKRTVVKIPSLFSFLQVASHMIAPISTQDTGKDPKENVAYWKAYAVNTVILAVLLKQEYAEKIAYEIGCGPGSTVV